MTFDQLDPVAKAPWTSTIVASRIAQRDCPPSGDDESRDESLHCPPHLNAPKRCEAGAELETNVSGCFPRAKWPPLGSRL